MASKQQTTSPWIWAFLLLLLASFVAFILFLDQKIVRSAADSGAQTQSSTSTIKPKIDFYEVLPDRKVEIPISDEEKQAMENPVINKQVQDQTILQVGSFQSAADAESLKAQLAFLGLEASVRSAEVNDETWHRVQLGPFASNSKLSRAINLLIENRIDYMPRNLPQ